MNPIALLAALVLTYAGWQLFDDGPLAGYVMSGALTCLLLSIIWHAKGRAWGPVCAFGIILGGMQSGCGILYAASQDGMHFLCDRGTGLPVSAVVLSLACLVVGYYAKGDRNG